MKRFGLFLLIILGFQFRAQAGGPIDAIQVKVFANTAIVSVYDFNYKNVMARQKATAKMFTGKGWFAFNKVLTQSQLINNVKSHGYTVTSVATAPPKIVSEGVMQGKYGWKVEMPVMVVYKNDSFQQVQYLDVTLSLVYEGKLLVREFNAKKGKAPACEQTSKGINVKPSKSLFKSDDAEDGKKSPSSDKSNTSQSNDNSGTTPSSDKSNTSQSKDKQTP